jgi:hypothetical protein
MHGFPLAAPGESRRRSCRDRVEHSCELCIDLSRAPVKEVQRGNRTVACSKVDDGPGLRVSPLKAIREVGFVSPLRRHKTKRSGRTLQHRRGALPSAPVRYRRIWRRRSRDYTEVGAKCVGECRDQRKFRPCPACRKESTNAGRIAVDAPRKLGLRYTKVNPQRVEITDHCIGLLNLSSGALVGAAVLRILHPARPTAFMQAYVQWSRVRHQASYRSSQD